MNVIKLNSLDISYNLARYDELCMMEFVNFGTQRTSNVFKIINMGQEIIIIEKYLANVFDDYVLAALDDLTNPNIYYIQNILTSMINLINHFTNLYYSNEKNIESYQNKQKYIVGFATNFSNKFLNRMEFHKDLLKNILDKSNLFSFNSLGNLKTFIKMFQSDFSADSYEKIKNIIDNLEN